EFRLQPVEGLTAQLCLLRAVDQRQVLALSNGGEGGGAGGIIAVFGPAGPHRASGQPGVLWNSIQRLYRFDRSSRKRPPGWRRCRRLSSPPDVSPRVSDQRGEWRWEVSSTSSGMSDSSRKQRQLLRGIKCNAPHVAVEALSTTWP